MLRTKLVDSIESKGIGTILHNPEAKKLLVSKRNGDVEVYSMENKKLKLFQTYPQLLQSSHTEETVIKGLYVSEELSTVFARCEKSLLLFNSTNLHKYDQIVDKRGIDNCWLFEVILPNEDDKMTYLVYSTKATSKLRMLVWEGRIYKKIVEATLGSEKEYVQSVESGQTGIILATNVGVYHWSYGESVLSRIDKIVKRKYPVDMVEALEDLKKISIDKEHASDLTSKTSHSVVSTSRVTKKSSILNFWKKQKGHNAEPLTKVRYTFTPSAEKHVMFDGITKNLFTFGLTERNLPYMEASNNSQFIEWNCEFFRMHYLPPNLLILSNKTTIRFVDYRIGFTFLQQDIPEGIQKVEVIGSCFFIVWTLKDQLKLFHYQVDDGSDDSFTDDESICGNIYDSDFYQLWRKVIFYDFFLNSPDALQLCESPDRQESLNLCALKLRDLTVLFCLAVFERFEHYMNLCAEQNSIDIRCIKLQEIIVKEIFEKFIKFWAPPQLVIAKTFPSNTSDLVWDMTGQKHNCLTSNGKTRGVYDIPSDLVRKWLLPYLVDIRRILKNMSKNETVAWKLSKRNIEVGLDFFLLNNHGSFEISHLLSLIDTVLFETYLQYFPSMIGPLLSVENMCDYDIVVEELRNRHKFQELVDFLSKRGKHEEALGFLTDLYIDAEGHDELREGIRLLVLNYLKNLSGEFLQIIFKYTEWLLQRFSPKDSILEEIFLNDSPLCANRDHLQIYEFIDALDSQISLEYLEFVISDLNSKNIRLHTLLIKCYFQDLDNKISRIKLRSVLESTSVYEPRTILRLLEEAANQISSSNTDQYIFVERLKVYPLQRLGSYEEAVNILFDELEDYDATSVFCEKVYSNDAEAGKSTLLHFFKKLIKSIQAGKNAMLALFLQEHSSKLNTVEIYDLLPDSVSLYELKEVLLQTVKSHFIKKDETRIKKNLLQVELINKGYELNKELAKYVIIEENYRCPICKKPFGTLTTDTTLLFDSDNRSFVVHYTCGRAFELKMQAKRSKDGMGANKRVRDFKSSE
ncbi:hypothetical protein HG535_0B06700 [Zygotorulaspora mrakii]|uniref:Vacuolar sorting protein 39/Transforming growth factor beta receptor-associated domain-containing protein n=1 Tax=Zygotorulaspora mrakii TaxID=42260 RepID=A0A7H9AZV2_ZYGMR|nr:uncharacterized protein HG535_0B06700 [Zygotorulaspora mrakii]QLG71624.1 hypothetical protein HG535_0B06700 [Zygotorulaspora mrakii]